MCDNKQIYGLVHHTSYKNFLQILKDKELKSYLELELINKRIPGGITKIINSGIIPFTFPGIYMTPIMDNTIDFLDKYVIHKDSIELIFSKVLLKRQGCHINSFNNFGRINSTSFKDCSKDINKFLKKNINKKYINRYELPEIVFHRPISIKMIEKVVVKDEILYKKLLKILPEKMISLGKLKDFKIQYIKYCNEKVTNKQKDLKNFCFVFPRRKKVDNCRLIHNVIDIINNFPRMKKECNIKYSNDSFLKKVKLEIGYPIPKDLKKCDSTNIKMLDYYDDRINILYYNKKSYFRKFIDIINYYIEENALKHID